MVSFSYSENKDVEVYEKKTKTITKPTTIKTHEAMCIQVYPLRSDASNKSCQRCHTEKHCPKLGMKTAVEQTWLILQSSV